METLAGIIILVSVVTLTLASISFIERRLTNLKSRRIVAEVYDRLADPEYEPPKLVPESDYVVDLTDTEVICRSPNGCTERLTWDDIQRVEILATADGPFVPDVFWVIHGSKGGLVIPQGATGEQELMTRLGKLSGFRYEAVIEAMPSTEERLFLCWERDNKP
jgi:hypothetical protein